MYFAPESAADGDESQPPPAGTTTFAGVPDALQPALSRRGFATLTSVQTAILAADDGRRDLRITSQTGSGKTVALGFVLARSLTASKARGPLALIVAPTRELAGQVRDELAWLFADVPSVQCEVVTGGTNIARERKLLSRRPAVLVGTPGRLLDHLRNGALDLSAIGQLVLDEADQMLDLGFKDELDAIVAALPPTRRTHLVSATFPQAVQALADRCQPAALLVHGSPAGAAHEDIEHIALKIGPRDHYAALVNLLLLAGEDRTLVFVRTREDTQSLADKLAGDGFLALPIHGDLAQAQRTRTLQAFKRGAIHTLIATDVAARGLDISDVTAVVHVDPPIDAATYVHRSGRTGRAGQKGRSYLLVVKSRESRMRRLYLQAKVTAEWQWAPGKGFVHDHQVAVAAQRAEAMLAEASPPSLHAIATRLLVGREPVVVVASLLARTALGVREPFDVQGPRSQRQFGAEPLPAAAPARAKAPVAPEPPLPVAAPPSPPVAEAAAALPPAAPTPPGRRLTAGQRGRSGAGASWHARDTIVAGNAPYVCFRINWGTRDGANARRVMAHVCRRGQIDSKCIGAIRVQFAATTFEVSADAAADFAQHSQRRDPRDPELVIEREGAGRAPRGRAPDRHEAE